LDPCDTLRIRAQMRVPVTLCHEREIRPAGAKRDAWEQRESREYG